MVGCIEPGWPRPRQLPLWCVKMFCVYESPSKLWIWGPEHHIPMGSGGLTRWLWTQHCCLFSNMLQALQQCTRGCALHRDGKPSMFGAVLLSSACASITSVRSHRPTSRSFSLSHAVTATKVHRRPHKSDAASFESLR